MAISVIALGCPLIDSKSHQSSTKPGVTLADERLVTANEEAARMALRELETFAATRVRKQGNQKDRITGNLVAAAFTHTSSIAW